MRRFLRWLALIAWLIASSMVLALFWIRNADAWNPIPRWIWDEVAQRIDIGCCEHAADVEYLLVLGASVLTMLVATTLMWAFVQILRKLRCRDGLHHSRLL